MKFATTNAFLTRTLAKVVAMLVLDNVETGYGKRQVLFKVSCAVQPAEILAVIGPNGSGKSTVLRVVAGLIPMWGGTIVFNNHHLNGSKAYHNFARGISLSPQGNRVFGDFTVLQNIAMGGIALGSKELLIRTDEILTLFPALRDRLQTRADKLSGGEQQMVALARCLVSKPRLLLLDEPSLGLSPKLIQTVFEKVLEINEATGVTVIIVEQKVREVLGICHRVCAMKLGTVAFDGSPREILDDIQHMKRIFL